MLLFLIAFTRSLIDLSLRMVMVPSDKILLDPTNDLTVVAASVVFTTVCSSLLHLLEGGWGVWLVVCRACVCRDRAFSHLCATFHLV